ncbi:hypothetical protein RvY_18824-2 [Ramazzottius varieornatus]|uniref:Uncharacterized protein n=1 Tax=Ramazzottius varieornatus TaxID=947166 RepID=A0A1D1W8K7_RAMVA|nr:hypothetical protein RvY_18824-2 [Ramazzottius varieornatus]
MKLLCPGVIFPETITLFGAPVFPEAIPPVLEEKIRQAELMTTRLEKISAHQALFLLKNCLSPPKLLYILRCSPTFSCLPSLQAFDETIRKCAGKIANIAMDDMVWRQSSLPVSRGALGTRRVDQLALPASLASVHSAFDLIKQIYPQVDVNCIVSPAISHWQVICWTTTRFASQLVCVLGLGSVSPMFVVAKNLSTSWGATACLVS